MTATSKLLSRFSIIAAMLVVGWGMSQTPTPTPEGHVTQIFHDVQLLPTQADARAAVINDRVDENTGLKTGADSRSELTFADLTITRLGANTVFSFNKAGRSVRLDSGSILLYVRKDSGGAEISTKAVSVGITGTTLIFESKPTSYDRLTVLEGDARFSLNDYPDQSTVVRAGQLLNVRVGSKKLPKPGRVNLKRIVDTHPLIKNFPPLPSLDLILAANQNPKAPAPGPPPSPPTTGQGAVSNPPGYAPNLSGPTGPGGYVGTGPSPAPPPTYWCCIDGQVVQSTEAECRARGGQAFRSEQEARTHCKGKTCWCCINGQVIQTTEADCREREGQCYGSRKEALKNCRGKGPTPTPTPHRHPTPKPTPRPTAKPTPTPYRPGSLRPTPTPKKRFPPTKRATPTPTPRKIIR